MTANENVAKVKEAYEAFKRGNIQAVLATLADDIDWITPGPQDVIPFVGHFKGRAAVAKFFESLAASEEVLAFEPHDFVSEGDSVVACLRYRARVKKTGREYEDEGIHFFQFRDGKIAKFREYLDTALMASAYRPR